MESQQKSHFDLYFHYEQSYCVKFKGDEEMEKFSIPHAESLQMTKFPGTQCSRNSCFPTDEKQEWRGNYLRQITCHWKRDCLKCWLCAIVTEGSFITSYDSKISLLLFGNWFSSQGHVLLKYAWSLRHEMPPSLSLLSTNMISGLVLYLLHCMDAF